MQTYKYEKIRNVVILGHAGCGKTTLTEAMAYVSGAVRRQGRVEDGNTVSDYDKEEIKRRYSISLSVVPVEWEDTKINILDTPGSFDFEGEVEEAIYAADAAVIVISAKAGIEAGTIKAWNMCEKIKLPRMFFVTDMDDDNASFREVVEQLKTMYGRRIAPFQSPIRENEKFTGFVNVIKMAGRRFTDGCNYVDGEIPDYCMEYVNKYRDDLIEAVAETSEELMEKYFDGIEFSQQEISTALRASVKDGNVVPVLMGSGVSARGAGMLMQEIVKYFPSPNTQVLTGVNTDTGSNFAADYDANKLFSAVVFKTVSDPMSGKISLIKICSGILKNNDTIINTTTDSETRLSRLYVIRGREVIETSELYAGDIGAIPKLPDARTGDSLSCKTNPVKYDPPKLSIPYTYRRYRLQNKADVDKVSQALTRLMEEDRTLKCVNDTVSHQQLIYAIGDQQLEVVTSRLESRYKVNIELIMPEIPYRETITGNSKAQGRHKKQSGGHGQFGDVLMEFEPSGDLDTPYIFEEKIVGGVVPKNFFPAVEKGIEESVIAGPLAGYPVYGVKAVLVDGSYHPVDSSEMAFKMAAITAFRDGVIKASPVILEPFVRMTLLIPEKSTGDVMGDINKRRGKIVGMTPFPGERQEITTDVPLAEIMDFSATLRAMTGSLGEYSYELAGYDVAPPEVQKAVIEKAKMKE